MVSSSCTFFFTSIHTGNNCVYSSNRLYTKQNGGVNYGRKIGPRRRVKSKKKIIEGQTKGRPRAEQKGDQAIFYA